MMKIMSQFQYLFDPFKAHLPDFVIQRTGAQVREWSMKIHFQSGICQRVCGI